MKLSYVFFGTPGFCVQALDALVKSGRMPVGLVCQPDRPKGRGSKICAPPTKIWAQELSVPILQPMQCKDPDFLAQVERLKPDVGLVFAFGQLLPKKLLQIPRLGFLNIHPSLLPRYRGAAPIQWALIHGDEKTGVSIVKVTPRWDDGDILLQESVAIAPDENAEELGERLAQLGGQLIVKAFEQIEQGQDHRTPQNEAEVVWAPLLKKEEGKIDFTQASISIHNRIRGLQPWPGAYCLLQGKMLKIHRASLVSGTANAAGSESAQPGQVVLAQGDTILVRTGDGLLRLLELQREGKNRMDARAFVAGRAIKAGEILS